MDIVDNVTAILHDKSVRDRVQKVLKHRKERHMGVVRGINGQTRLTLFDKPGNFPESPPLLSAPFEFDINALKESLENMKKYRGADPFHSTKPMRKLYDFLADRDVIEIAPRITKEDWYWQATAQVTGDMHEGVHNFLSNTRKRFGLRGKATFLYMRCDPHPAFELHPALKDRISFSEVTRPLFLSPPDYSLLTLMTHKDVSPPTTYAFLRVTRSHPNSESDLSFALVYQKHPWHPSLIRRAVARELDLHAGQGSQPRAGLLKLLKGDPIPIPNEVYTTVRGIYNPVQDIVGVGDPTE